jgi:hypothetical protein
MKKLKASPLDQLITAHLTALGANRIPAPARRAIEADVLAACETLVHKRLTGEYVGRMVAAGLAAKGEGFEGEAASPSTSRSTSTPQRGAQANVAGPASNPLEAHDGAAEGRRQNDSTTGI